MQNTYGQILILVLDKTMSGLEPLREARGMPNHPLPTTKYPELYIASKDKNIGDKP
jgi:hypothetical protein